jgi:hypothetical protein
VNIGTCVKCYGNVTNDRVLLISTGNYGFRPVEKPVETVNKENAYTFFGVITGKSPV